jgi:RNA polymerase sigma-70 factor (ECF subfamily)
MREPRSAASAVQSALTLNAEFSFIYDAWFGDVLKWARALGASAADREDIAQEVFLVVRRRMHAFDGVNAAGWLYRITRRQVRDFRRRAWIKHIFTRDHSDAPEALPDGRESPVTALEREEKQRVLHMLLAKMNDDRRAAFVLFEIDGLSGEQIARIQSVPVNTVWQRLHVARKEFFALAARYQRAHGLGAAPQTPHPRGARR